MRDKELIDWKIEIDVKHFIIHLSITGYLGSFHILAIVAMNMSVQMYLQESNFISFGNIHRNWIHGSHNNSIQFHEEFPYCFPQSLYQFTFPTVYKRPFFPTYYHHMLALIFLIIGILTCQFSCSVMSDLLWPIELQHTKLSCPSPTPEACSNSCPSGQWCHPIIPPSVVPFSSRLQSFPT